MEREYYILWYRLDNKDGYLIWYSENTDGVVTNDSGKVLSFNSRQQLLEYAAYNNIRVHSEETTLHNLDAVDEWIKTEDPATINFTQFNEIWNLWADVAESVGVNFDHDSEASDKVYDKLFWSRDLPSATTEDKRYYPVWTEEELKAMRQVFTNGVKMFREAVTEY